MIVPGAAVSYNWVLGFNADRGRYSIYAQSQLGGGLGLGIFGGVGFQAFAATGESVARNLSKDALSVVADKDTR